MIVRGDSVKTSSRDWRLWVLLAGYVIASLTYAIFIPWGGNPDEKAHYEYIQYLAEEHRLPVFKSNEVLYEAHQPPLYYLLSLPFYWLGGLLGTPKVIRLLAVLTGAGVLACTYWTARRLYPKEEGAPLLAGAVAGFLPSTLTMNASVGNDSLATLVFSVFALWCAGQWRGRIGARTGLGTGLLVGVAMMTKLTSLMLALLTVVAILLFAQEDTARQEVAAAQKGERGKREQARGPVVRQAHHPEQGRRAGKAGSSVRPQEGHRPWLAVGLAAGTALVICGWWVVRNQIIYGEPFVVRSYAERFSPTQSSEFFLSRGASGASYMLLVVVHTFWTFWGSFGQAQIFMPTWVYMSWLGVSGAIVGGWVVRARRKREREAGEAGMRLARLILLLEIGLLLAFLLRLNVVLFQAQARYLLIGATPIAIFMAVGLLTVFPERWRKRTAVLVSGVFFAYGMLALLVWGLPGYAGR